ncbi:hypothetical protein DFH29DRAFT_1073809, partial [Suillus ampliporus]
MQADQAKFDAQTYHLCFHLVKRLVRKLLRYVLDESVVLSTRMGEAIHGDKPDNRDCGERDSKSRGQVSDIVITASLFVNSIADDVEESRAALQRYSPGDSRRSACLHNLATHLHNRFNQRGVTSDLDEAIEHHRAALLLLSQADSSNGVFRLTLMRLLSSIGLHYSSVPLVILIDQGLSIILPSAFKPDLSSAAFRLILMRPLSSIRLHCLLCPPGDSDRSVSLNNLANGLTDRFKQRGVPSDLDEAIEHHRAALLLRPPGHSDRSASLNNLAVSLTNRFKQQGVPSDLDEAIELHRAALLICPPGQSDRSASLNNLAVSLEDRFKQRGVLSDLDEAIELHRAALLLRPPGHHGRSASLNNLANGLTERFKQHGVPSDFDEAIELHRAALLLRPSGHSDRSASLNNLAVSLTDRFEQRGVLSDLDEAIEFHRAALHLRPPSHSDRSASLNNLAISLRVRFRQRSVLSDLDEAIELYQAALLLYPPGHYDRSASLHNLAIVLQTRFEQRGVLSDLDEAIELYRAALLLRPPGHHGRSASLHSLAISLTDRFEQRGVLSDLDEASRLYLQLSYLSHAACSSDLRAAKAWVTSAEKLKHGSTLIAYQTALKFLDQHVALLSSSPRHFDVIREATSSLATDAFSCSIRHGVLTTAVELVEQGRAVFWTQLARFRTPLDELSLSGDTSAALAEELKRLSFYLRNTFDQSTADQSPQIRQLTMQWDDVISR